MSRLSTLEGMIHGATQCAQSAPAGIGTAHRGQCCVIVQVNPTTKAVSTVRYVVGYRTVREALMVEALAAQEGAQ